MRKAFTILVSRTEYVGRRNAKKEGLIGFYGKVFLYLALAHSIKDDKKILPMDVKQEQKNFTKTEKNFIENLFAKLVKGYPNEIYLKSVGKTTDEVIKDFNKALEDLTNGLGTGKQ